MEVSFKFDFSDHFDCALSKLIDKWEDEEKGLLQGLRRLFGSRIEDSAWLPDLVLLVHELWYWRCLRKVLIHIHKCSSNADKIVPNLKSFLIKFEAAFSEIAEDITRVRQYKKIAKRPYETLRDSEKKISLLQLEIGEVLDQLSSSCSSGSLEWHLPVLARSLPDKLLTHIPEILGIIELKIGGDDIVDGGQKVAIADFKSNFLSPLQHFIEAASTDVGSGYPRDNIMLHNKINSFGAHIAHVFLCIANQSLHYWINKNKDPIVARSKVTGHLDLQREIDPLTPQFLELALQYLRVLDGITPGRTVHLAHPFLIYTLTPRRYHLNRSYFNFSSLMIFAMLEWEEPQCEDVQGFLAEIKEVIVIAGFSSRCVQFLDISSFHFCTRLCLLNTEVFLKQQLKRSFFFIKHNIEELNQDIKHLRSISHQKQQEGNQSFTFIDQVTGELASLYQSFSQNKVTEHNLRIALSILLLNIVFFKAESTCKEFLKGNANTIGIKNETFAEGLNFFSDFVSNQQEKIQTLLEGLNLFRAFVTNQQEMTKGIELIFARTEAIAGRITCISFSFLVRNITEEISKKWTTSFSDLLDKMTLIKAELREICPQLPRFNFPKIQGIDFMDFLLENLLELIKLRS